MYFTIASPKKQLFFEKFLFPQRIKKLRFPDKFAGGAENNAKYA